MLQILQTQEGRMKEVDTFMPGSWIRLIGPSHHETNRVADHFGIELNDVIAALDMEESPRITHEDHYSLILIDIPISQIRNGVSMYSTIPLGILLAQNTVITICMNETPVMQDFRDNKVKDFSTRKQMRFIYQILMNSAILYQRNLRAVDKKRIEIEARVSGDVKDNDLIELHELESTLVYFATSLRADRLVLQRLVNSKNMVKFSEDEDLLEDVTIEYKQAIEMTGIYRDIIDGTRELLSSVIDNRLNNVMKYLTSITLVMAIPTIVSGLFGMNVNGNWVPLANTPYGFGLICLGITILCGMIMLILRKKKML